MRKMSDMGNHTANLQFWTENNQILNRKTKFKKREREKRAAEKEKVQYTRG